MIFFYAFPLFLLVRSLLSSVFGFPKSYTIATFGFAFPAEVVISPPFLFLPLVKTLLRPDFSVAAQNCWVRKGGAFTGEVRYAH